MSDFADRPSLKGHRPHYFDDPTLDQLHSALLAVTQELAVARERIDSLERILESSGHLDRSAFEHLRLAPAAEAERAELRTGLVTRVLEPFVAYRDALFARAQRHPGNLEQGKLE
jgi:hypothetical protein